MALKHPTIALAFSDTLLLPDAYIRVTSGVVIRRQDSENPGITRHLVTGTAVVFVDAAAAAAGKFPVADFTFEFPVSDNTGNPVAWIYEQLKQLPQFAGAQDC